MNNPPSSLAKNKQRDLLAGSTRIRALMGRLHDWLEKTDNRPLLGRVFQDVPSRDVEVSYAAAEAGGQPPAETRRLVNLGAHNYAGLNNHPKVLAAAEQALRQYGTMTCGARLMSGTTPLHLQFEQRLAAYLGVEDAVTYSSGFVANLSVLGALCSEKDVILYDELVHQSLIEGARLSGATLIKYKHVDIPALRETLAGLPAQQRKLIVTDGIFSMEGDVAPLDVLADLADEYGAFLLVDDAHGTGAFGPHGRGTLAQYGVTERVDIITGSLSKGLPGVGGFAAGSRKVMELLRYGSAGYIFSASLPPSVLAGLMAALDVLESEPAIQDRLRHNEVSLREGIRALGLDVLRSCTPIIPVRLPDRVTTFEFARRLHEEGVYVNPVCFPAVPRNAPRLRINASAALEQADVEHTLASIDRVSRALGLRGEARSC